MDTKLRQELLDMGFREIDEDEFVIERGKYFTMKSPSITQSGGYLRTCDSSAPTITQSGGYLLTYDSSTPSIMQSDGYLLTYDSSAPTITQSGGYLRTYDSSAPSITQSGGVLETYDSSAPSITQRGGKVTICSPLSSVHRINPPADEAKHQPPAGYTPSEFQE